MPRPRSHLIRYHGLLAPNARHRRLVVPAPPPTPPCRDDECAPAPGRAPMTWMQGLRRVFNIDLRHCPRCGAPLRVLAAAVQGCTNVAGGRQGLFLQSLCIPAIHGGQMPEAVAVQGCTNVAGGRMPEATITDPRVIAAILEHIDTRTARAPPPAPRSSPPPNSIVCAHLQCAAGALGCRTRAALGCGPEHSSSAADLSPFASCDVSRRRSAPGRLSRILIVAISLDSRYRRPRQIRAFGVPIRVAAAMRSAITAGCAEHPGRADLRRFGQIRGPQPGAHESSRPGSTVVTADGSGAALAAPGQDRITAEPRTSPSPPEEGRPARGGQCGNRDQEQMTLDVQVYSAAAV